MLRRYAMRWLGLAAAVTYLGRALGANWVATRSTAAGRLEDAADQLAKTVKYLRKLAFVRPNELKRLGDGLMAQWLTLFRLKRTAEALVVAEENVAVWQILAANHYHRLYLAQALDMLEGSRSMAGIVGRHPATDELLRLRSELADEASRKHAHSLTLAAEHHVAQQDYAAALPLLEQIVRIRRTLAATDSDRCSKLINGLTDLGHCLTDLGDHERARAAHAEVLELAREADATGPTELAARLVNLAGSLRELQRYDEAVPLDQEAVVILRADLHSGKPHEKAAERLAWALSLLSDDLRAVGRFDEARTAEHELETLDD
ncbi:MULTISPECIES: tetratricopeptide repeat protein [unclassified Kribbella]|uniref:tetratricopeptide repeat protein n=1 Tax=unclassified Kribbella TaxID=2644121 RepID=UPI0033DED103